MYARRALAGSFTALLLPASLLLVTGSSSATDAGDNQPAAAAVTTDRKAKTKVKLVAHPQLAQQGKKATSANKALSVFTGTVKPGKPNRPVVLQMKKGGWKTIAKGKTLAKGRVEIAGKTKKGAKYRLTALPFKGAAAASSKPVTIDKYLTPLFSDEFTGSSLSSNWTQRQQGYFAESLRACSKGDPRATAVTGGTLRLSVLKDPDRSDKCDALKDGKSTGMYAYRLNGHVGTMDAFSFKYGYAAARIKMHKSRGQHSSFWMQPAVPNNTMAAPATGGAEIDIIEYFGDKHPNGGLTSFTYSYNNGKQIKNGDWIKGSTRFLANKKDGWSKNYHVFSVEWTPKEYIFRIDGKETWRTKVGVSGVDQYLILSLLSSDYALNLGGDKVLPQHNYVDWVRVWGL